MENIMTSETDRSPSTAKSDRQKNEQHEYKLFEANDIAKYGLFYAAGNVLNPIAYKGLMYLIWKAVSRTPESLDRVELSITEFGEALGYSKDDGNRNFSRNVKNACNVLKTIMSQPIQIHDPEREEYILFNMLTEVDIRYGEDRITVEFAKQLNTYFGQKLKSNFTVVRLKYLNRLNRTGSVILYPFFCRYANLQCFVYAVSKLAKLLTNNDSYVYKYLKRDYIDPAIEEINRLTDLHVEYNEEREGHCVTKIVFYVDYGPAEDEAENYMIFTGTKYGDYHDDEYSSEWMSEYDYDMSKQKYVRAAV